MKIVVVAGAAGISIAARARRLDELADIMVSERGHHVSFATWGLPYHLRDDQGALAPARDARHRCAHRRRGRLDRPRGQDGAWIIDVRGPGESGIRHIPGPQNVPLTTLRSARETWDRGTPIRPDCADGFRSHLAYSSLVKRGFTDVKTLSGGSTTFRAFHDVHPTAMESTTPIISCAEEASSPTAGPKVWWSTWTAPA